MNDKQVTIMQGNAIGTLSDIPDCSVQCVVTSPPYFGLRDYGTARWEGGDENCDHLPPNDSPNSKIQGNGNNTHAGRQGKYCKKCGALRVDEQIGLEETPEEYVEKLVCVFREVKRVLKDDGVLWLNLGDSYWGGKGKSGYELPEEAKARRRNGKTLQSENNVIGKREMRPTDGKHPVIKPKDLIGIPWMVAFALRADGWCLRQDIIWSKPNPMPESVTDRCTKSHEYIFLMSKSRNYYYDYEAILEPANYDGRKATKMQGSKKYQNGFAPTDENPNTLHVKGHERRSRVIGRTERKMAGTNYGGDGKGLHGHSGYYDKDGNPRFNQFEDGTPARNKRSVWTVVTKPYKEAHFATFPCELIEPCILAGSREGDTVLDPFNGSGTTGEVAIKHHRKYIGIEINPDYVKLTKKRLSKVQPVLMPK